MAPVQLNLPGLLYMFIDDTDRIVSVPEHPRRIISLCPSITETLCAFGLGQRVAGRTRYCIHPADKVRDMRIVGGTRDPDMEIIRDIEPDLVFAVKEENRKEDICEISSFAPTYVFDVRSFGDSLMMMLSLGRMMNMRSRAIDMVNEIELVYSQLPALDYTMKYLYLVWRDPWMGVSQDTYIDSVLACAGFKNCLRGTTERYPVLDEQGIRESGAELVILPSEPFPFSSIHREEIRRILPRAMVVFADGEMMSWFGARMLHAGPYLNKWILDLCSALSP